MVLAADLDPVGQIVVERIAVVEKTAFLDQEPPYVGARASAHPADRPAAGDLLEERDRGLDVAPFDRHRDRLVVDPAIVMAHDLVAGLDHGSGGFAVALERGRDREHADLDLALFEYPQESTHAAPGAVFEHRLDKHAARASHRRKTDVG